MLRRFTSRVALPTTVVGTQMRFARVLPQGFDFIESKVQELDPHTPGETLPQMQVNLTRHDEVLFSSAECKACVVPANDGEAGIAPGHEYEIAKLEPGTISVETMDGKTRKFVCSGGFAHINPVGSVDINCAEAIPIEDIDANVAAKELAAAQDAVKAAKDDKDKAVAELEVQMLEAVQNALKSGTA